MPPKTTIFLHIHKTAGTTFNHILSNQYTFGKIKSIYESVVTNYNSPNYKPKAMEEELSKEIKKISLLKSEFKLVRGHFAFGIHEYLSDEYNYITLLREPISRFVSHYYFIRDGHIKKNNLKQFTLEDYMMNCIENREDNRQTRLIAGNKGIACSELTVTQETLSIAKNNLSKYFSCVGTTEDFNIFLYLCQQYFGWENIYYHSKNKNKNKPKQEKIQPYLLAKIKEMEFLDIDLYNFGKELMKKKFEEYRGNPQEKVAEYNISNQSFNKNIDFLIQNTKFKVFRKLLKTEV